MKVMGYEIFDKNLNEIEFKDKTVINTINPHSYVVAKEDGELKRALLESDVLVPDGSGIVLAAKFLKGKKIKKIAGADVHKFLLEKAQREKLKVFYMGSSQNTLNKIKERLKNEYPDITAGFYSPPFKESFSEEENREIVEKINEFKPDILFIGMTAPKQEKWLNRHKDEIYFNIASSVGAVFDFYAGNVKRPPQWIINLHLEWLFRFLQEPKRLWRRNFISTPLFLFDMLNEKIKKS